MVSNRSLYMLVLLSVAGVLVATWWKGGLLVGALILGVLFWLNRTEGEEKDFLVPLFLASFAFRAVLAVGYYYYFIAYKQVPLLGIDGEGYSAVAWYQALVLRGIDLDNIPTGLRPTDIIGNLGFWETVAANQGRLLEWDRVGVGAYTYFLTVLYYLVGYAPVTGRLINAVLGGLLAVLSYQVGRSVFGLREARLSAIFVAILPFNSLLSVTLLRDMFLVFAFLVVVRCLVARRFLSNWRCYVGVTLATLVIGSLRFLLLELVFAATLLGIGIRYLKLNLRSSLCVLMIIVASGIAVPKFRYAVGDFVRSQVLYLLKSHVAFAYYGGNIYKILPERYYAYPNYLVVPVENLERGEIATALIKGPFEFYLSPLPWEVKTSSQLLAVPQMVLWYLSIPFLITGVAVAVFKRNRLALLLTSVLLLTAGTFGMAEANIWTAFRHRELISAIHSVLVARGLSFLGDRLRFELSVFGPA